MKQAVRGKAASPFCSWNVEKQYLSEIQFSPLYLWKSGRAEPNSSKLQTNKLDQHVSLCDYIKSFFWKKSINSFCWTWMGQLNCWKTVIVWNSKSFHRNSVLNFFTRFFSSGGQPWDMWGYPSLYLMVLSSIVLSILN